MKEALKRLAVAGPALVVIGVCCALPLGWMALVLLTNPAVWREFAPSAYHLDLLGRTLGFNLASALIATAMGLPAAFALGRGRGVVTRALWVILPASLILPSLSYSYGWLQVIRILRPMFRPWGVTFRPNGMADILRCIWSLGTWLWAVPAVLIGLSLRRMDPAVQQQAALDGALRRVTLRHLLPAIFASVAIVTVLATQEFAVYEPTGISVVATEVRMVFDTGSVSSVMSSAGNSIAGPGNLGGGLASPDQPARAAAAVATAMPLVLITIALAALAAWAARVGMSEELNPNEADGHSWPRSLDASRWTVALTVLLVLVTVGVPVAALVGSLREPVEPWRMWHDFGRQVQGALLVAGEAALVAAVAAAFCAAGRAPGLLLPAGATFLVGGQLLAIALIRVWNRPVLSWAYDTSVLPVVAYVGRFGWIAVAAGAATWTRPWRELRQMASLDGAGRLRTAASVIWPAAWPTLLAGALLVGALSLTEVPATVLLMPQHPQVLTPKLMTWVHMSRYDPMIQASLLMMAAVLVPAVAAVLLASVGGRWRRAGR